MRISRRSVVGLIGLAIVVTGCDGSGSTEPSLQVEVFALAPCPEPENGNQQLPENSDRVVVRLSEGPISASAPIFTTISVDDPGPTGKVAIPEIPEGSGIRLDAVACNANNEPTWSGSSFGIAVQAGHETSVDLFMTPLNVVTCTGRHTQVQLPGESPNMPDGHAFAAVAPTNDGAVVLGGFNTYDPSQSNRRLTATGAVTVYDASRSSFLVAGTLESPRAMAGATVVQDGLILVVGGTREMALKSLKQPPLSVTADDAPKYAVELFQPPPADSGGATVGASVVLPCFRLPNLPALTVLDGKQVLSVGGIGTMLNDDKLLVKDANGVTIDDDACVAVKDEGWSSSAWLVGVPLVRRVVRSSATVARPRYGATVIAGGLESPQRALIWGGNTDGDAGVADWFEPADASCEIPSGGSVDSAPACPLGTVCNSNSLCVADPLDPGRPDPEILNLQGISSYGSSVFASGVFVNETSGGGYQFLVLGGTDVSGGEGEIDFSVAADTSRAELITVDPASLTFISDPINVSDLVHDVRRAAAKLVPLGAAGQDIWMLGGFTSFTADEAACPGRDVCLQEDMLRFKLVEDPAGPVGTYALQLISSLELTVGSFGVETVLLRDGSRILIGGMKNVTSSTDAISKEAGLVRYEVEHSGFCGLTP